MVKVVCNCGAVHDFPDSRRGQQFECVKCGLIEVVPSFYPGLILPGSLLPRLAAFVLDLFFVWIVCGLLFELPFHYPLANSKLFLNLMGALLLPVFLLTLVKDMDGMSPGKWVMGLALRSFKKRTEAPGLAVSIARNLFVLFFPLEALWSWLRGDHRRIGDLVSRTIVVKNENPPLLFLRIVAGMCILVTFYSLFMSYPREFKNKMLHYRNPGNNTPAPATQYHPLSPGKASDRFGSAPALPKL